MIATVMHEQNQNTHGIVRQFQSRFFISATRLSSFRLPSCRRFMPFISSVMRPTDLYICQAKIATDSTD
jgi:hypothetical protein